MLRPHSRALRVLAMLLALPLLVLAACGDDEDKTSTSGAAAIEGGDPEDVAALEKVEVTEGEEGKAPTIEFDKPFTVGTTVRVLLEEGEGEEIKEGSVAIFDFLFLNGRDASELANSFGMESQPITVESGLMDGVRKGLLGLKAGSRAIVAIAPDEGFAAGQGQPPEGVEADDTILMYIDLHEVSLSRADGTAVDPVDGLPTVKLADDGAPTITVPAGEPPTKLVAQLLIEGDGPEVEAGQNLTVHYTGVLWDGGEQFDSSWESGTPASFPIGTGGVIPGWDEGLVGQTVGSQVLLVIPPDKGYGEEGQGTIPGGATLVFVVDILAAT